MELRGAFLSDLHLFSRRSLAVSHWSDWAGGLKHQDFLILGGDIFDFRWSHHGSVSKTIQFAEQWLYQLLDQNRQLQLIYIMGNHDCLPAMRNMLEQMSDEDQRLNWCDQHVRMGNKLFLHGDVVDAGGFGEHLRDYRLQFVEPHARGKMANHLYDAVIASRVHRVPVRLLHHPQRVTSRLANHLSGAELGRRDGVEQVYFGHTHAALHGFSQAEQTFFNSGSAIKHLAFNPLQVTVTVDELSHWIETSRA